ncbi:tyrosine-type recombinase/integrase [Microbacterium sp. CFBP 8790]|uniref:tyrosine-type recombinase/integrase n=1 Tax=unclassified Microbacterium TaxID=2609290 RepID=UPI00177B4093|nr:MULTISPECIES: tyrosine-type recombinase/integrase [unclassified Microbacterium]MBD8205189.1 tyrosine-type recombinase/integrase [Microbacterium sp. CFBP 8801]MBD8509756.1 tyrosine-type recombinase/integrase [Microbacterium sp. CFBP 8790]
MPHRLRAHASSEAEVIVMLKRKAAQWGLDDGEVGPETALKELLEHWVEDRRGQVELQTLRIYTDTARWLSELAGTLTVDELRPARIKRLLSEIERSRSASAYHHARVALSGALSLAVESDVLQHNPVRSVRRRDLAGAMPVTLTVSQVPTVRAEILLREGSLRPRIGGSAGALRWTTEVILGSGLRTAEVLALRMMDFDRQGGTISVSGTLVDDERWAVVRQDHLKSRAQARRIELPQFAIDAIEDALLWTGRGGTRSLMAPLIQGWGPSWIAPRNLRRSLREVRRAPAVVMSLAATGLTAEDLTPRTFRRTAATLVAAAGKGDLRAAQKLLGHSDMRITLKHYAGAAYATVGSASILEDLLGSPRRREP